MDKFWRWVVNEAEEPVVRILYLEGYIAESSWFDDDVTPKQFKTELYGSGQEAGDIIVKIHSPGGDCFAAAQIYNMLMEYPGKVSIHVDGLAASAASVIAMAGDEVCVSPLSVIMVHNPAMFIAGEAADLQVGINLLSEVKESIINAYQNKTGLTRTKISHMMDAETWMSAHKAIELKFADRILYEAAPMEMVDQGFIFDQLTVTNTLLKKLPKLKAKMSGLAENKKIKEDGQQLDGVCQQPQKPIETSEHPDTETNVLQIPIVQLEKRLNLIKNWR
ncbi:MAG TPA: Clp protease ClpP [Atribacterota bacterium]|nr:Clp protease ClpP [Atribacterota bacterium]HPK86526.1 Clp protease ClpP [Atribacterota bacterium]